MVSSHRLKKVKTVWIFGSWRKTDEGIDKVRVSGISVVYMESVGVGPLPRDNRLVSGS